MLSGFEPYPRWVPLMYNSVLGTFHCNEFLLLVLIRQRQILQEMLRVKVR